LKEILDDETQMRKGKFLWEFFGLKIFLYSVHELIILFRRKQMPFNFPLLLFLGEENFNINFTLAVSRTVPYLCSLKTLVKAIV